MEIPTWEDIADKVTRNETLNPLEVLIYENEPEDWGSKSNEFRVDLQKLVDWLLSPKSEIVVETADSHCVVACECGSHCHVVSKQIQRCPNPKCDISYISNTNFTVHKIEK